MTPRSRRPIPHERLDLAGALLLDRLPDEYQATARQNDGPTNGSVLRAVVDCDCERLYDQLRSQRGVDDAVMRPHELDHWLGYDWREGRYHPERWYRAWWD